MSDSKTLLKGDRIKASWFKANLGTCLAGMQMKVGAGEVHIVGLVAHLRGDHPIYPASVRLYVDVEQGNSDLPKVKPEGCTHDGGHVEVNPDHVTAFQSHNLKTGFKSQFQRAYLEG